MDDSKIIELYWLRDQEAIAQTDMKYGRLCRSISLNIVSDFRDSEECVEDTYMAAWNSMPPQRPRHLNAWLAVVVRKLSLMRLRSSYAKKKGGGTIDLVFEELGDTFASDFSVEREYEGKELAESIAGFLPKLSQDDRRIFLCRYWLFAPVEDIARRLGCSKNRVAASLFRSRQKLRKYLMEEGLI